MGEGQVEMLKELPADDELVLHMGNDAYLGCVASKDGTGRVVTEYNSNDGGLEAYRGPREMSDDRAWTGRYANAGKKISPDHAVVSTGVDQGSDFNDGFGRSGIREQHRDAGQR